MHVMLPQDVKRFTGVEELNYCKWKSRCLSNLGCESLAI